MTCNTVRIPLSKDFTGRYNEYKIIYPLGTIKAIYDYKLKQYNSAHNHMKQKAKNKIIKATLSNIVKKKIKSLGLDMKKSTEKSLTFLPTYIIWAGEKNNVLRSDFQLQELAERNLR